MTTGHINIDTSGPFAMKPNRSGESFGGAE